MENKIKQLRKGVFELIILGVLHNESHYGYSLVKEIIGDIPFSITEGTIYPILSRLSREGLIKYEWVESKQGPPRKYYHLTRDGRVTFQELKKEEHMKFKYMSVDIEVVPSGGGLPEPEKDPIVIISMCFYPAFKGKNSMVLRQKN